MQINNRELILAFKGKLIAQKEVQIIICQSIRRLPDKMICYLIENCWFLSSTEDSWAYTFNGNDVGNKHFIFLSDELLIQPKSQIIWTILHEIGHIILNHKNSIGKLKLTKYQINKQEKQADNFANLYIN